MVLATAISHKHVTLHSFPCVFTPDRSGVILTNHLVHFHCSPTRRSFVSGRLPLHHGEDLSGVATDDLDLRWTLISGKLQSAGYKTHWIGKGHTGYVCGCT
jgi:arylsulfatase A-like enzyme